MKWVFRIFVALYALALALYAIGMAVGLGGSGDMLVGMLLLILGFPWGLLVALIGGDSPILGLLCPAINAAILFWLWKRSPFSRSSQEAKEIP